MTKEFLIEAVGYIDHAYLADFEQTERALQIRLQRQKKTRIKRTLIAAAALLLTFTLLVASLPIVYITNREAIDDAFVQAVDRVLFPLDKEQDDDIAQKELLLDWTKLPIAAKFVEVLGAGTQDSVIDFLQGEHSGLAGELLQSLGAFLERLYEYYMDHKDDIEGIIDDHQSESESESEIESDIETETETETESEIETEIETLPDLGTEQITEDDSSTHVTESDGTFILALSDDKSYYTVMSLANTQETVLIIPETFKGLPVKAIEDYAFSYCDQIFEVVIPDSVENIGASAFAYCSSLTYVKQLPKNLKVINDSVFLKCQSLQSVELPNGLEIIGSFAFMGCASLQTVNIPESVTRIESHAFFECYELKLGKLPESMEFIGSEAFRGTLSNYDLVIPKGITEIEQQSFYNTGISSLTVPDGVERIGIYAFSACGNLTSVSLSNTLKEIAAAAIIDNNLLEIIEFRGTVAEWENIVKDDHGIEVGIIIQCVDGQIVIE